MVPALVAFYVTMISYPIIRTNTTPLGAHFRVVLEGEQFSVLLYGADGEILDTTPCLDLNVALSCIRKNADENHLEILLDTLMLPVGQLIVVQSEVRGAAREEVRVFHTQADYDTFRRERLADYKDDEDGEDVAGLLESGHLDAAWTMATEDDADVKCLWDTHFGYHFTRTEPNFAPYTELPDWLRAAVVATLKP